MPSAIDKLRHPRIDVAARVWRTVRADVDLHDDRLDLELTDAPSKDEIAQYGFFLERVATSDVRALILTAGLRAYAKALEARHGAETCRIAGASGASLMLLYDASYLAARSFAILLGFAPTGKQSSVTIDALFSYGSAPKGGDILDDNMGYFVYGRWSHENIWDLVGRLSRTLGKSGKIDAYTAHLRSDKLKAMSNLRNSQIYNDMRVYSGDVEAEADFPDFIDLSLIPDPVICDRYRRIYQSLSSIILEIIDQAGAADLLSQLASEKRKAAAT